MKKIPGSDNLSMGASGKIYGCPSKYLLEKNDRVTLTLYGIQKTVSRKWLRLITHFEVSVGEEFLMRVGFKPTSYHPTRSLTRQMMTIIPPIEHAKGFRIIPMYTRYAISSEGVIIDTVNDHTVARQKATAGCYCKCTIYDPEISGYRERYIHRLVAMAWVDNEDYLSRPQINHIDGNKNNFDASNLEWVSNSENSRHAFVTGLNPTTGVSVTILDTTNGRSVTVSSLIEASSYMGLTYRLTDSKVRRRAKGSLYRNRYVVTHLDGVALDYKLRLTRSTVYQYKHINGGISDSNSLRRMKRVTGDDPTVVVRDIELNRDTYSANGYSYRLWSVGKWRRMKNVRRVGRAVRVMDKSTGVSKTFSSIREASRELNMDRSIVQRLVRGGGTHINKYKNLQMELL